MKKRCQWQYIRCAMHIHKKVENPVLSIRRNACENMSYSKSNTVQMSLFRKKKKSLSFLFCLHLLHTVASFPLLAQAWCCGKTSRSWCHNQHLRSLPDKYTLRATARASAAEDLDEGPSELDVEGGVDNRVEGAVDVPQPGESAVKPGRHVACPAVGVQYVSHKERQPADEEHPWRSGERGWRQKQGWTSGIHLYS